ncbi:MAG TPA: dihydroorotate dehydrogenase-like protein [Acidimicrobiia bacterium]|nr:dihydroorotate dehydrogenase-like protein [Acidimicrobiia bacterium]
MSVDLRTTYMGLELAHPVMPSASPLTGDLDTLRRLEDAGASAVVLPSLFEEQIEHEEMEVVRLLDFGSESFGEAAFGYFPELADYATGPSTYLDLVSRAKSSLSIPVIGSINGTSKGGWIKYGKLIEEAGADALELNVHFIPTDPKVSTAQVEQQYLDLVMSVKQSLSIPLAVKIGPFFSSIPHIADRLVESGADALVIFNRFYQPDIDIEGLQVQPDLQLSTSTELRLPLRWTAILRGFIKASLAVTTGVHTSEDVIKLLLVGADVTMMASALLKNGPDHLRRVVSGVEQWLNDNDYESIEQLKGSLSQASSPDPGAFERANYMKTLVTYAGPFV